MKFPSKQRLQASIDTALQKFSSKQLGLLRSAFTVGGHRHHGGDAWAPRVGNYPHPILLRTGQLRGSIQVQNGRSWTMIRSNLPQATFIQRGTRHMPPRPIIVVTEQDKTRLLLDLRTGIERLMRTTRV